MHGTDSKFKQIHDTYRKVVKALKEKDASFHTYQFKKDKRYKIILRGICLKTNINDITYCHLTKKVKSQSSINDIVQYNTKTPLPLFFIELEPNDNNKEIFQINRLLNIVISVESPRTKREIPQCIRCQEYGHTNNYCNKTPVCVKYAKYHLTTDCSHQGKIENAKCFNCQ